MFATRRARWAFLLLALAQHALFAAAFHAAAWSTPAMSVCWFSAHLAVLARVLLARPPDPAQDATQRVIRETSLLGTLLGVFTTPLFGDSYVAGFILGTVFGCVAGAALGVGFLPMLTFVGEWRRRRSVGAALNAWAALAVYPAVAGAVLTLNLPGDPWQSGRVLSLVGAAIGLAVVASELWWRRRIGRVLAGGATKTRPVAEVTGVTEATPDWSLATTDAVVALVEGGPRWSYRDPGAGAALVLIPTELRVSWRLWVLPVVVAVGALRWWG